MKAHNLRRYVSQFNLYKNKVEQLYGELCVGPFIARVQWLPAVLLSPWGCWPYSYIHNIFKNWLLHMREYLKPVHHCMEGGYNGVAVFPEKNQKSFLLFPYFFLDKKSNHANSLHAAVPPQHFRKLAKNSCANTLVLNNVSVNMEPSGSTERGHQRSLTHCCSQCSQTGGFQTLCTANWIHLKRGEMKYPILQYIFQNHHKSSDVA